MIRPKFFKYLPLLFVFFTLCSYRPMDNGDKEDVLLTLIMQGLQINHFQPKDINDDFSKKVHSLYIERLDPAKRFLLQSDINELKSGQTEIDDEIKATSFEFFDKSYAIIAKRNNEAEAYYKKVLAKPFDFSKEEQIELDGKKIDYAANTAELQDRWRQFLKYQTLTRIVNRLEAQEKAKKDKDTSVEIKSIKTIEEESRTALLKSQEDYFNQIKKLERDDYVAVYLNSIANTFDPHTEYFPPKDKENFDIAMSGQLEGIGAQLMEKSGYIEVSNIVPGSASWKQGTLKSGDVILSVGEGNTEPVDIVGMRLDKAVQLIRGKKGSEVRLTVRKIDGTVHVIPIIRDVVILEESFAKSAIIEQEDSESKIGYIQLPSFYADFSGKSNRSSGEDVKKEIEALKKQNINGLVLDLRNNGGGSLQDVVEMAGLFIDKGPIVQVKARTDKPYILADKDPAIQWEGPLVILVNEFSASASEILAAAIQDYRRGVVIGSKSFGKGTVQQFFDLDQFISSGYNDLKPLGSLKLTTQKFYRINGGATQIQGVVPDVALPDAYVYLNIGEKDLDNAMPWSEITAVPYKSWKMGTNYSTAIRNSSDRVSSNAIFKKVDENAKRLKMQSEDTKYSLNMDKYKAQREKATKEAEKYKDIEQEIPGLTVEAVTNYSTAYEADEASKERMTEWKKNLRKDAYIYEAMSILKDLR